MVFLVFHAQASGFLYIFNFENIFYKMFYKPDKKALNAKLYVKLVRSRSAKRQSSVSKRAMESSNGIELLQNALDVTIQLLKMSILILLVVLTTRVSICVMLNVKTVVMLPVKLGVFEIFQ